MQSKGNTNDLSRFNKRTSQTSPCVPKLCSVCFRASFLKCSGCETIYCSSICQLQDWEKHQSIHHYSQDYSGRASVQSRLKIPTSPINAPPKEKSDDKLKRSDTIENQFKSGREVKLQPSKVDSVSSISQSVSLATKDTKETLVELTLLKLKKARKFKTHVSLDDLKDEDGFSCVKVMTVKHLPAGSVFWVMPWDVQGYYIDYELYLNQIYAKEDISAITTKDLSKFKPHIVITKINNRWSRNQIVDFSGCEVDLENIDTGGKAIVIKDNQLFKLPQEHEMEQPAFSFCVKFENVENPEIESGDIIKIRITRLVPFGVHWAEIQIPEDASENGAYFVEDQSKTSLEKPVEPQVAAPSPAQEHDVERFFIDCIQVKDMNVGQKIKLLYCDGTHFEKGKLFVFESSEKNWKLYAQLEKKIADYVNENPSGKGYAPIKRELVLAKFKDGKFHRAFCVKPLIQEAKVHFIDYGSTIDVNLENIMKMPSSLFLTCCAHQVNVMLSSGRHFSEIDCKQTLISLSDKNEFFAEVREVIAGKFNIWLDDSLIVYQH